jgi:transposase InsO family protein
MLRLSNAQKLSTVCMHKAAHVLALRSYNPHRRHSGLDYLSPMEYERRLLPQPNTVH